MRRRKPEPATAAKPDEVPPLSYFAALAAEMTPPGWWVKEPTPPQPPPEAQIAAWRSLTAWRMWKQAQTGPANERAADDVRSPQRHPPAAKKVGRGPALRPQLRDAAPGTYSPTRAGPVS